MREVGGEVRRRDGQDGHRLPIQEGRRGNAVERDNRAYREVVVRCNGQDIRSDCNLSNVSGRKRIDERRTSRVQPETCGWTDEGNFAVAVEYDGPLAEVLT